MIRYTDIISVEDYNKIRKAVGWKVLDEKQARSGLDNSLYVVAAYDDDEAVGSARIIGDGGYMYLVADVMVLPEYHGKGIGGNLLRRINRWFDDLAEDGSCVMVNLMATSGNEGFYEKFGFIKRPNEKMGAGMVRWINE